MKSLRSQSPSALTAFFGQAPLLYASGPGADIQRPLAVVVMGGLVTSTLLTLLVLPSLHSLTRGRAADAAAGVGSAEEARTMGARGVS